MASLKVRIRPGFDANLNLTELGTILFRYETGLITEAEADKQLVKLDRPTTLTHEAGARRRIKQLVSHLL